MNTPSIQELRGAEALLAQPTRACGLRHEDAMRGGGGDVLYETTHSQEQGERHIPMYLPECPPALKHIACPHFRVLYGRAMYDSLYTLGKTDPECGELTSELERFQARQEIIDISVRTARIGKEEDRQRRIAPSIAEAEKGAKPLLEQFEMNRALIDEVRVKLLEKVRATIERLEGTTETA